MGAGELAHVFFSLQVSCEAALADKFYFMPVLKIDMTAPCPCIGVWIFFHYADEGLITMRIRNSISLPVFRAGFHATTVFVVGCYSKRNILNYALSRWQTKRSRVRVSVGSTIFLEFRSAGTTNS
jgi:hypothetical protein